MDVHSVGGLLISTLVFALGCSAPGPSTAWVQEHGGAVVDQRQARAEASLTRLVRNHPEMHATVHVLASDAPAAYSWANGHIFLSVGLIDRVNQEELMAALAHELGHLLGDGHVRVMASLRGCDRDRDAEVRADAVGIRLLQLQGLPTASMITLLEKVQTTASLSPTCQEAMQGRIRLLRQRLQQE